MKLCLCSLHLQICSIYLKCDIIEVKSCFNCSTYRNNSNIFVTEYHISMVKINFKEQSY